MKKNQGSRRGLFLPYADFIEQTKQYGWDGAGDSMLLKELNTCVQGQNNISKAFSILKEIICRKTGLSLFDSQLAAAYSMTRGHIAELPTGEGKTFAAVAAASYLALKGKRVHILVFNDYLAERDYNANLPIYTACGLNCGFITEALGREERKRAYLCSVVYVSAKEAAFDYLRDFLCMEQSGLVFGGFSAALVDEADSILINEARTPLVLAGEDSSSFFPEKKVFPAVSQLLDEDIGLDMENKQVWLCDSGIEKLEKALYAGNLFTAGNSGTLALINAALSARYLLQKDKDYIVRDGAILVIDEETGRVAENRRFPDLIDQATAYKENLCPGKPSLIYNSMSMQAFLLQYPFLCGMTGTAKSAEGELFKMYGMEVDVIPPHLPCIRKDYEDRIFINREKQLKAVIDCLKTAREKGQPVLLGTGSVEESERVSALLKEHGLPHQVLNARNNAEEACAVARAGEPYRITVSTNISGRGVDIKLGGAGEDKAAFVKNAGGLVVLSTHMNRSVRIDDQLRGRAGRQGDPGESSFFICLEDIEMDSFFALDFYKAKRYPKLLRRAQRMQEGRDAQARLMLTRYSAVLEKQRQIVTGYRTRLLNGETIPGILKDKDEKLFREYTARYGDKAVALAQTQLTLYFINQNWSYYLAAMEEKRRGIHLVIVGGRDPLEEYQKFAASAFDEMTEDIKSSVFLYMQKCRITQNGVDMESEGLSSASTAWTYMIDDSADQFSRIPYLVRTLSNKVQGTVFTVQELFAKAVKRRECRKES